MLNAKENTKLSRTELKAIMGGTSPETSRCARGCLDYATLPGGNACPDGLQCVSRPCSPKSELFTSVCEGI